MSEKYIDLGPRIFNTTGLDMPSKKRLASIHCVLHWLDEHPDQVPGRTITESELYGRFNSNDSLKAIAEGWGITVVPDPEPTNAEKIATEIDTYMQDHGWGDNPTAVDLAGWLSDRGVKAPGGDDD